MNITQYIPDICTWGALLWAIARHPVLPTELREDNEASTQKVMLPSVAG